LDPSYIVGKVATGFSRPMPLRPEEMTFVSHESLQQLCIRSEVFAEEVRCCLDSIIFFSEEALEVINCFDHVADDVFDLDSLKNTLFDV
jgi:hypothetical protein